MHAQYDNQLLTVTLGIVIIKIPYQELLMQHESIILQKLREEYTVLVSTQSRARHATLITFKANLDSCIENFLKSTGSLAGNGVTPMMSSEVAATVAICSFIIAGLTAMVGGTIVTKAASMLYNKIKVNNAQSLAKMFNNQDGKDAGEAFCLQAMLYHHGRITDMDKEEEDDLLEQALDSVDNVTPEMLNNSNDNKNKKHMTLLIELVAQFINGLEDAKRIYRNPTHRNFIPFMAQLPLIVNMEPPTAAFNFVGSFVDQPQTNKYSIAIDAARLTLLAHEDKTIIDIRAKKWGYETDQTFFYKLADNSTDGSIRCIAFVNDNTMICMMRGPKGWLKAGKNFINFYQSSLESIWSDFEKYSQEHLIGKNINRFLFTGHGAGGALAIEMAARFYKHNSKAQDKLTVLTFGARVSATEADQEFEKCVYRFEHEEDSHTQIPINISSLFKSHIGSYYLIPDEKSIFNWESPPDTRTSTPPIPSSLPLPPSSSFASMTSGVTSTLSAVVSSSVSVFVEAKKIVKQPFTLFPLKRYYDLLTAHAKSHGMTLDHDKDNEIFIGSWQTPRQADELFAQLNVSNTSRPFTDPDKHVINLGYIAFSAAFLNYSLESQRAILKYLSCAFLQHFIKTEGAEFTHPIENWILRLERIIQHHIDKFNENTAERALRLDIIIEAQRLCWWLKLAEYVEFNKTNTDISFILEKIHSSKKRYLLNLDALKRIEVMIKNDLKQNKPIFSISDMEFIPLMYTDPLLESQNVTQADIDRFKKLVKDFSEHIGISTHWIVIASITKLEFLKDDQASPLTTDEMLVRKFRELLEADDISVFRTGFLQQWILENFDQNALSQKITDEMIDAIENTTLKLTFQNNQYLTDNHLWKLAQRMTQCNTIQIVRCPRIQGYVAGRTSTLVGMFTYKSWIDAWAANTKKANKTLLIKDCLKLHQDVLLILDSVKSQNPNFNIIVTLHAESTETWSPSITERFATQYPDSGIFIPTYIPVWQSLDAPPSSVGTPFLQLPTGRRVLCGFANALPYKENPAAHYALMRDNQLVVALPTGMLTRWKLQDGKYQQIQKIKAHLKKINNVAHLKNDVLLTTSEDGVLRVWEMRDGLLTLSCSFEKTDTLDVTTLVSLKNDNFLIYSEKRNRLSRWQINNKNMHFKDSITCHGIAVIHDETQERIVMITENNFLQEYIVADNILKPEKAVDNKLKFKSLSVVGDNVMIGTLQGNNLKYFNTTTLKMRAPENNDTLETSKMHNAYQLLQRGSLHDADIPLLFPSVLTKLDISHTKITDTQLALILKHCSQLTLKDINIEGCYLLSEKTLTLKKIWDTIETPTTVESMFLKSQSLTDHEVLALHAEFPQVKSLKLSGFSCFSGNTLMQLEAQGLTLLTLVNCPNIDLSMLTRTREKKLKCDITQACTSQKKQAHAIAHPEAGIMIGRMSISTIQCIKTYAEDVEPRAFVLLPKKPPIYASGLPQGENITAMTISREGKIYVGTSDGQIFSEGENLKQCNTSTIDAMLELPDGSLIISADSALHRLQINENETNAQLQGEMFGAPQLFAETYVDRIRALAMLSNGDLIGGLSDGAIVRYFSNNYDFCTANNELYHVTSQNSSGGVIALIAFPRNVLVSVTQDGIITAWKLNNNKLVKQAEVHTHEDCVCAASCLDGSILCLSKSGTLQQWQCMGYEPTPYIQDDETRHLHNARQLLERNALYPAHIPLLFSKNSTKTFDISNTHISDFLLEKITSHTTQLQFVAKNCPYLTESGWQLIKDRKKPHDTHSSLIATSGTASNGYSSHLTRNFISNTNASLSSIRDATLQSKI